jgi:hypothetical protein
MDRIEELVAAVEAAPDPVLRDIVQELLATVLELHGRGLSRLLEIVHEEQGDAAAVLGRLAGDEAVRPLLELHDLLPPAPVQAPAPAPVTFLPRRTG